MWADSLSPYYKDDRFYMLFQKKMASEFSFNIMSRDDIKPSTSVKIKIIPNTGHQHRCLASLHHTLFHQ